mgnify:CR=1 FL=1
MTLYWKLRKIGSHKPVDINLTHFILTPARKRIPGNDSRNELKGMTPIAHGQKPYARTMGTPPNATVNRCVFNRDLKVSTLGIDLISKGRSFHTVGRNTDILLRLSFELALILDIFGCLSL